MSDAIPTADVPGEANTVDGRRARRARGRTAVVDALFALLQEQGVQPAVEEIAARAGVSVSSIFRYFDGLDDLRELAIGRYFERFAPLFEVPNLGEGQLPRRLSAMVDSRLALYQAIAPIAHIARLRALETPRFATTLATTRAGSANQVRTHFAAELGTRTPARGDDLVGVIDSITSFESWELLRDTHGRSQSQIRRAWTECLQVLLASGSPTRRLTDGAAAHRPRVPPLQVATRYDSTTGASSAGVAPCMMTASAPWPS